MNDHDQPTSVQPTPVQPAQQKRPIIRPAKIAIGCSIAVAILTIFSCALFGFVASRTPISISTSRVATVTGTAAPTSEPTAAPTATPLPTSTAVVAATATPTAIVTKTPTPLPTPTSVPTPQPTQPPVPTPIPTQPPPPTPTPIPPGVNGNPWGFNFVQGNLIYNPPAAFCGQYFSCVTTFWSATNGYVEQCVNGLYSHSGGVRGACSRDGGAAQTLYSH